MHTTKPVYIKIYVCYKLNQFNKSELFLVLYNTKYGKLLFGSIPPSVLQISRDNSPSSLSYFTNGLLVLQKE